MSDPAASRPPLRPPQGSPPVAPFGHGRVEVLEVTPSTNAVVADRARAGDPEGLVVVAEHQSSGRGRLGRSWESPPRAGLTFSVLLRPNVADRWWPWLPLLAGIAVVEGLEAVGTPGARLKWPNDVTYGQRKVAGVLTERVDTPRGPAGLVGIGVNVSTTAEELPVATATSLAIEGGAVDRGALLEALLLRLESWYAAWTDASGDPDASGLAAAYQALCATVGTRVRVDLPGGGLLEGTATGVDGDGALLVLADSAEVVVVNAGDVVHVRPVT